MFFCFFYYYPIHGPGLLCKSRGLGIQGFPGKSRATSAGFLFWGSGHLGFRIQGYIMRLHKGQGKRALISSLNGLNRV